MYDPEFLNASWGPAKTIKGRQAPRVKGLSKITGMKATHSEPLPSNRVKEKKSKWVGKKRYGHIKPMLSPFPESV